MRGKGLKDEEGVSILSRDVNESERKCLTAFGHEGNQSVVQIVHRLSDNVVTRELHHAEKARPLGLTANGYATRERGQCGPGHQSYGAFASVPRPRIELATNGSQTIRLAPGIGLARFGA